MIKSLSIILFTVLTSIELAEESFAAQPPNILFIAVDDLRPELRCYGVDYIHSPHIDRLAATGRVFRRHYVQAPTCGASRYALLTGRYGDAGNQAIFQRAKQIKANADAAPPSMPAWFRMHGYTTVAVGKVSHHPGGMGGKRWDDPSQLEMPNSWDRCLLPVGDWQDPRGWMHGLAHGEVRVDAKQPGDGIAMDVFQSTAGPDSIYPDGISIDEALQQLDQFATRETKPFFLAVGILRPHLPFGAPEKYLRLYDDAVLPPIPHPEKPTGRTTWHRSGEFMKYNRWERDPNTDTEFATQVRKHYAACVSYADAQIGRLLEQLRESGADKNTIVVLWGDHGWHLGEHAIWGKHALFEESLRSPLIVSAPGMSRRGEPTDSMVETVDIFPTLCELTGLAVPDFVQGISLRSQLANPTKEGHPAIAYSGRARTIRTETHRLVLHTDGYTELYDHTTAANETKNLADSNPKLVEKLIDRLEGRLSR